VSVFINRLFDVANASGEDRPREQLTELAARIYETRRTRDRFLQGSLFGEPVWDMLLSLYCGAARGEKISVSGLCFAAGVPQTTALRWTQLLEQKKLIERSPDPNDKRRVFLSLSEQGDKLMSAYLASIYTKMDVML
jgi:DNA-binding MarR family transcriptional regulator